VGTRLTLVGLVILGSLAGCAEPAKPPPPPVVVAPPPPVGITAADVSAPPVAGPFWTLESLNGVPVTLERQPTLSIDDAKATGSAGCNNYGTNALLRGSNLTFSGTATTKMACMEPANSIETQFLAMLDLTRVFTTTGGVLVLYDVAGKPLARFTTKRAP
jgi:heat shock protein HslJ